MAIHRAKNVSDDELWALIGAFESRTTVKGGVISYRSMSDAVSWYGYELLPGAFKISPPIDRSRSMSLFRKAIKEARLAGDLTPSSIRVIAERIHHKECAVPEVRYTLWTKFRATDMAVNTGFRLSWSGVDIRTEKVLPSWLELGEYFLSGWGHVEPSQPAHYGYIVISCTDRHENAAVDRMLDAVQIFMGLLNLYVTGGRTRFRIGKPIPSGVFWLGPYQFLFKGRESTSGRKIFYNPNYDQGVWNEGAFQMSNVLKIVPKVRSALKELEDHPLREVLGRSICVMQDGFEARSVNQRLLRYWSALERIYVEEDGRGASNEKVIRRAAFAEKDPKLARWTLRHIAGLRNEYVHAGEEGHDISSLADFLQSILFRHINHWIFTGRDFATLRDLISYVDLPADPAALKSMKTSIDRRIALSEEFGVERE